MHCLYAALKCGFSCIKMQSKHGVFGSQYQKLKKLETLSLQTWHTHTHPTFLISAVHPSDQEAVDKEAWHCLPPECPFEMHTCWLRVVMQGSPIYRHLFICAHEWAEGITSAQMHAHLHTWHSFNQGVIHSLQFSLLCTVIVAKKVTI